VSEKKGGERRGRGAEEQRSGGRREKGELIIFGDKAQKIPPKISFTLCPHPHCFQESSD